nr:unnamed protein product [Callosobruchus analis]
MWWTGPVFLKLPQDDWPLTEFSISLQNLPEVKKNATICHAIPVSSFPLFLKYSHLNKLVRVVAFSLRFIKNLRTTTRQKGILTPDEINQANLCLIKLAQRESFSDELNSLKKHHTLHPKHKFSSLSPFLDDEGIIRVGGRLKNTHLPFHSKHPILLSSKHVFTKLIFDHKHKQLLHPGPQLLLASVRRFTSRRGVPAVIYSDNGSTFVGANNKLKNFGHFLYKNQSFITDATSEFNIKWIFIPPYTPNHGGLWEAAVKSMKHHLLRTIKGNVTYEEFNTLIIQVEGILNSRPLFALSSDPNDLAPVTPSHFLIGRPLTSIPESNYMEVPQNRLLRLEHLQQLYQRFWHQFSKQYVSQLHQQYKWKGAPSTVAVDSLVLVKSDFQPPCTWPVGRVLQLFPGKDGVSRIAEVKTHRGTVTRSIRHLCPLPVQNEIDN